MVGANREFANTLWFAPVKMFADAACCAWLKLTSRCEFCTFCEARFVNAWFELALVDGDAVRRVRRVLVERALRRLRGQVRRGRGRSGAPSSASEFWDTAEFVLVAALIWLACCAVRVVGDGVDRRHVVRGRAVGEVLQEVVGAGALRRVRVAEEPAADAGRVREVAEGRARCSRLRGEVVGRRGLIRVRVVRDDGVVVLARGRALLRLGLRCWRSARAFELLLRAGDRAVARRRLVHDGARGLRGLSSACDCIDADVACAA